MLVQEGRLVYISYRETQVHIVKLTRVPYRSKDLGI